MIHLGMKEEPSPNQPTFLIGDVISGNVIKRRKEQNCFRAIPKSSSSFNPVSKTEGARLVPWSSTLSCVGLG